jgi:hypothetical protein
MATESGLARYFGFPSQFSIHQLFDIHPMPLISILTVSLNNQLKNKKLSYILSSLQSLGLPSLALRAVKNRKKGKGNSIKLNFRETSCETRNWAEPALVRIPCHTWLSEMSMPQIKLLES